MSLDPAIRARIEELTGHCFSQPDLIELALTHASTADSKLASNERLEFLGDAVLAHVVCRMVYDMFPAFREGEMTKIKSHVVSREACAAIGQALGLDSCLILGKGMQTGGTLPASLPAAAMEALIGALCIDAGFDKAKAFVEPLVRPVIDRAARSGHHQNFKSVLQQHAQRAFGGTPQYRTLDEQGPDHSKNFCVCVELSGRRFAPAWGSTKKKAEQDAALNALREMGLIDMTEGGESRVCVPEPSIQAEP